MKHRKLAVPASGLAILGLIAVLSACGTTKTVTVTKTVPGPAVTVTVPGPVRTVTAAPPSSDAAPAASPSSEAAPAASPSPATADTVTFIAYGTCDPDITYGSDGSTSNGYVGMDQTVTIPSPAPSYYAINAQCQQNGSASVIIKLDGTQISSGVANGAYNIASAQIGQDPVTGQWKDENSG
ncbi:MAG TPA: hypothetical protein VF060_22545 [Trebonia sp.]